MRAIFEWRGKRYSVRLDRGIDLSIPYSESQSQVNCFFAPYYKSEPFMLGSFVGSVAKGGTVNFYNTQINVHGSGTHTECYGHIHPNRMSVLDVKLKSHMLAELCTVYPTLLDNGDRAVTLPTLKSLLDDFDLECLILRTMPNGKEKRHFKYSGTNPCYIMPEAMEFLVQKGLKHLLVDLPSVDREDDAGKLECHRKFWEGQRAHDCTITELIYVPAEAMDGLYLLNLQLGPMDGDAAPSRPVIYALEEYDGTI